MRVLPLKTRSGFTLIELLVVIAIIAILIALLVPAVQKVRDAAARTQCTNNLKQIGLALQGYHDANKRLPPGAMTDQPPYGTGGAWGSSWKVFILPYIDQGVIFQQWLFTGSSGYQNANNIALVNRVVIAAYRCPATAFPDFYSGNINGTAFNEMFTTYTGIMGSAAGAGTINVTSCCDGGSGIASTNGLLYAGSDIKMTDIVDGSSNTWLVGEQSDHVRDASGNAIRSGTNPMTSQGPHGWTMGSSSNNGPGNTERVFNCSAIRYQINQYGIVTNTTSGAATGVNWNTGANIPLSSIHGGNGANILFADGTVRFYTADTPLSIMQALATRAGREPVQVDQ